MRRIERDAVDIASNDTPAALQALLVHVVAALAQRLMIDWVPEELVVAFVRRDVVDYFSRNDLTATLMIHAQRMLAQVTLTVTTPARPVPTLRGGLTVCHGGKQKARQCRAPRLVA